MLVLACNTQPADLTSGRNVQKTTSSAAFLLDFPSPSISSEPAVPGDDEEATAVSPEPEPEAEKEAEVAVTELKAETMVETQTDLHTSEEPSEKNLAAAQPTAEGTSVPSEPATAAPEENRVGPHLPISSG